MTLSNSELVTKLTEISVFVAFVFTLFSASGQGRRWMFTVIWAAVAGFVAEFFIVHAKVPRYAYTSHFWVDPWDVPVAIGLGWGMVFYAATWTAQRLRFQSLAVSSLVAGVLGVNLDLSLDPAANAHGLWRWNDLPGYDAHRTLGGVPFDNFVAWVVLVAAYGFFVRAAFRWVNRKEFRAELEDGPPPGGASLRPLKKRSSVVLDYIVPPISVAIAGGLFALVRNHADKLYQFLGWIDAPFAQPVGEAVLFTSLLLGGMYIFWRRVFRAPRNQEVNWIVLGIVIYLHALSFALAMFNFWHGRTEVIPFLVIIPINLVAGFLAYAWPSIDELFDASAHPLADQPQVPKLVYKTLSSYGGEKVRALVCSPTSVKELTSVLNYARSNGKLVTFRAGGQAFDTQSLNKQIVISLDAPAFKNIKVNRNERTVTVGCSARWGDILKKTMAHDLAPFIMVTSSAATAGGTLSSHSLSRFSPTCGREGKYVKSLLLLTPDGNPVPCSRGQNDALFRAVIGGLGYLGVVLEITYELHDLPKNAVVKTDFTRIEGLTRIAAQVKQPDTPRFSPLVRKLAQERQACQKAAANGSGRQEPIALSAAVNMRGGVWSLIARSNYETGTPFRRSVFHRPTSIRHTLLQLCAPIPFLRAIGYYITFRLSALNETKTYYDELQGYTFFEDGNRRIKKFFQFLGCPTRVLQQTFILPLGVGNNEGANLEEFLEKSDALLDGAKLSPALIDVLYVGADGEDFPLSSSQKDGYAVTFTFERLFRPLIKEEECLMRMSEICKDLGGRIHLVKNVCADPKLIIGMYPGMATMATLREAHAAKAFIYNDFAKDKLKNLD
jgi:decaprenylphospho-beta-D-ribofuranose 2-oxidase